MRFKEKVMTRLASWSRGEPAAPHRLILYMTSRCNLDCLFCDVPRSWRQGKENTQELSAEEWVDIVEQGLDMGVKEWWFPGLGETMFYGDKTLAVLRTIKNRDPSAFCHMTTNGTFFTEDMARTFVKLGMDDINFSVDGPDAATHDELRNLNGAFKATTDGMRAFARIKSELGVKKPEIFMTTVLTHNNFDRLDEMVDLAAEVGAVQITINPMRISHENESKIKKNGIQIPEGKESDVRRLLKAAQEKGDACGVRVQLNGWSDLEMGPKSGHAAEGFAPSEQSRESTGNPFFSSACYEPFYTMGIDAQGKASYCASSCGSGTDESSVVAHGLEAVWQGSFMARARQHMLDNIPFLTCYGCGIRGVRKQIKEELIQLAQDTREPVEVSA